MFWKTVLDNISILPCLSFLETNVYVFLKVNSIKIAFRWVFFCCCYFYVWDYQCWQHLNANIAWMLNNGTPESQLSLNSMQFSIFTNLKGNIAWKQLLQLFIGFLIHQMWLWLSTRKESRNEKNLHTYEISMLLVQHRAQCSICFFVSHFF